MAPTPRKPTHLGVAGAALHDAVSHQVADDGLALDAREAVWLDLACRESDQLSRIEIELASADLVVRGSQGQPVANGLLAEATRSRLAVAGLLARLKLEDPGDLAPAVRGGRGSATTSESARKAALARWNPKAAT